MKYKHDQLIKDYIADMSQMVQYQYPNSDKWITWPHKTFPSFDNPCEWRLLPAPKPDVVIDVYLGLDPSLKPCIYVVNDCIAPNIRATWDGEGELKSVEKI
jgi:hypothetical protein